MGSHGVRVEACCVVLLSVVLLMSLRQVQADFGWFSSASSGDLFMPMAKSGGSDEKPEVYDEHVRRVLASSNGYIGYGALTARNVPCAPRSGRSYYTQNCRSATGQARPYTRGCGQITRCARS